MRLFYINPINPFHLPSDTPPPPHTHTGFQLLSLCCPLDLPENRTVILVLDCVITFVIFDALREAKVTNLHSRLVLHQHVSGSQVTVDVILRSQIVHSLK